MKYREILKGLTRREAIGGLFAVGATASLARPVRGEQAWGRVFIFNTAPEPVSLELNKLKLPDIVGTARDDYYIPDVIAVDRSSVPQPLVTGEFAGKNHFAVSYPDLKAQYEIIIDPDRYRFDQDMQMYVHRDGVILLRNGLDMPGSVRRIS
jgi:hypothetical protein